jgi:hypothetical protein
MSTDTLTYVLSSLKRAAENAYPWSLTPNEAGLLVAEVEHLRGERAAVVAWLRAECGSPGHEERFCAYCNVRRNIAADIERGEHRRKEKP